MGMAMKSIESFKQSKGAVAPLVAIMLILIVVCVALVVDLGHIHNVKVQLQRAADAAALAGAQELSGLTGASANARNVAVATALANSVDQDQVVIDPDAIVNPSFNGQAIVAVQPIRWDPNIVDPDTGTNQTTNDRITPLPVAQYDTANGLWVTAQRDVDHVFFFFTGNTQVTADAIAVATPEVPVLPLAIVTCIPAEQLLENPGSLPDMTVCGISAYSFDPDPEDTAAWTSLTLGANANAIASYMNTETGRETFNSIIFGKGIGNFGLENETVAPVPSPFSPTFQGCPDYLTPFPNGTNIPCGLGRIDEKDLATQEEFILSLPPIPNIDPAFGGRAPGFDPLTDYGKLGDGALPRWYNLNGDDGDFDNDDHFTRVWSQDGILIRKEDADENLEPLADYLARLATLANCPVGDLTCRPYGDDRFLNDNFIIEPSNPVANDLEEALGIEPDYWPDFLEVMKHAGYPKVGVINGDAAVVLSAFVENEMVTDGTNLICSDNGPFPAGEKSLRVNAPVIFAGACESWTAIANASSEHELRYIGMSKLLLTRVWKSNSERYDCGDDSEVVQLHGGLGCSASDFDPGLRSGIYFSLPAESPPAHPSLKAVEGVTLVPVADDEEDQGSLLKVFLVE
jgi:Flp pilus assembly protein TadG